MAAEGMSMARGTVTTSFATMGRLTIAAGRATLSLRRNPRLELMVWIMTASGFATIATVGRLLILRW